MSREEFISKLQMVYVGDRNAFNDIICAYDSLLCKNEKAIEYINENVSVYAFNNKELPHWEFDDDNINDLLNILQNGSDSQ